MTSGTEAMKYQLEEQAAGVAAWERTGYRILYLRAIESKLYENMQEAMRSKLGNFMRGIAIVNASARV